MNGEAGKGSKRRQEDSRKVREGLDRIDWGRGKKTTKRSEDHTIKGLTVMVYDEVRGVE